MLAQNPKFVSVELGGNEVLNARNGIAIEGASMYPFAAWAPLYDRVLDEVGGVAKEAVVVGLIDDVASFPAFRRGYEMAAERATFKAAFNVDVAANCDNNENLLFVPILVPTAVGTGLYLRQNKIPASATLSCAAKGPTEEDLFRLPPRKPDKPNPFGDD